MLRTRSMGSLAAPLAVVRNSLLQNCAESPASQTTPLFGIAKGTVRTMNDHVTPGFRKLQQKGGIVFTPMYSFRGTYSGSGSGGRIKATSSYLCNGTPTFHEVFWTGEGFVCAVASQATGGLSTLPPDNRAISATDIARASTEASTRVLSQRGRSDSNLWETLAEADKALASGENILRRALAVVSKHSSIKVNMYGRMGRNRLNGAKEVIQNDYLMWRYGIKPLISDFDAMMKGLKKDAGKRRQSTRSSISLSSTSQSSFTGGSGNWLLSLAINTKEDVTIRAMSLDEFFASVAHDVGFSAKGLITLPWELVRFSFVADWFANIGDNLGAITPSFGYNQLGSCLVLRRDCVTTSTANVTSYVGTGYTVTSPFSGSCVADIQEKIRGPLTAPGLVINHSFGFDRVTRVADACALLAQALLRYENIGKPLGKFVQKEIF